MKADGRWLAAALAALLGTVGCAGDPDVVVEGTVAQNSSEDGGQEGGRIDVVSATKCVPGTYEGQVTGEWRPADAGTGAGITFKGEIAFTLEQSLSGEFLQVTNSMVVGSSDMGFEFSATVGNGGGCREGDFTLPLDGAFSVGTSSIHYTGDVTGNYIARSRTFSGEWGAIAPDANLRGGGTWWAGRIATED